MAGDIVDLGRVVLDKRTAGELRLQGAGPDGTGLNRGIEYENPEDRALRGPYETGCREGCKCVEFWLQRHRVDRVVKVFMQDLYVPPVNLAQVVADSYAYYALLSDGTVLPVVGESYDHGQAACSEWSGIAQITAMTRAVFGVRSDGSVAWAGAPFANPDCSWFRDWSPVSAVVAKASCSVVIGITGGRPQWETFRNANCLGYQAYWGAVWLPINDLDNVVGAALSNQGATLAGAVFLHADGRASYVGQRPAHASAQVGCWSGLVQVAGCNDHCFGLRADGTCVAAGSNAGLVSAVTGWTDIKQLSGHGSAVYGLRNNGDIVYAGTGLPQMSLFSGGGYLQLDAGVSQLIARGGCAATVACRTVDPQEIQDLTADANSLFDYCL